MTATDLIAALPILIPAYAAVMLMLILPFWRSPKWAYWLTIISLAASVVSIFIAIPYAPRSVTPLLQIDAFSLFFAGLILSGALLITLFCRDYFAVHEKRAEAFYILLLFSVVGMEVVAASAHFAAFFVGLEALSISLYGLIGYTRRFKPSLEAAIKYLVLAATSSAFLLFGIALVYFDYGTMDFQKLLPILTVGGLPMTSYLGIALILVGFGFKLALAPFHMWSPDVYSGAPAPVTALIATGSKGAILTLLVRLIFGANLHHDPMVFLALSALCVATMFAGNLLALMQNNVKRLLAFSSVAQMGYLLIPIISGGTRATSAIAFYLVSYFATTIAAFGVISVLSSDRASGDIERIEDYRGQAAQHPILAAILAISMLSLIGLPPTSGFFGKFYLFTAAAQAGLWWLLIIGVINSGISAFYYLRVVFALYSRTDEEPTSLPTARTVSAIALGVCAAIIVIFGLYPAPLFALVRVLNPGF